MTASQSQPDELDRLFAKLVRTIRDERPEFLAGAFEVADLLSFVPYKSVRADIGVDTNDDYAHAVTRLLAGERGYLFIDDLMQDDLQHELQSPNPDLAAYRSYLNSRISLAQERVREVLDASGPAPVRDAIEGPGGARSASTAAPKPAAAPSGAAAPPPSQAAPAPRVPPPATSPTAPVQRPIVARPRAVPSAVAVISGGADARSARPGCRYCGQPLPQGRDVRFCPHCGQDLSVHRCGACSAELEPGWKFCVACGRSASA